MVMTPGGQATTCTLEQPHPRSDFDSCLLKSLCLCKYSVMVLK